MVTQFRISLEQWALVLNYFGLGLGDSAGTSAELLWDRSWKVCFRTVNANRFLLVIPKTAQIFKSSKTSRNLPVRRLTALISDHCSVVKKCV